MKNLFIVCFILSFLYSYSQNYSFETSDKITYPDNLKIQSVVCADSTGYYIHLTGRANFKSEAANHLVIYDRKFHLLQDKELPSCFPLQSKIIYSEGKFLWFHSIRNSPSDKVYFVISSLSKSGELLDSIIVDTASIVHLSVNQPFYKFSPDTKLFSVVNHCEPLNKKEKDQIFLTIYDSEYKRLVKKDISEIRRSQSDFWVKMVLTNDTTAYLLERTSEKGGYRITTVSASASKNVSELIEFTGKKIANIELIQDTKGNVHCTGFYTDSDYSVINGMFDILMTKDGASVKQSMHEFSDSEIADCHDINKKFTINRKGVCGFKNFFVLSSIINELPGRSYYLAEAKYVDYTYVYPGLQFATENSDYLMLFEMTGDFESKGITVIPKSQYHHSNVFALGHLLLNYGDTISFLYNESRKNIKLSINDWNPRYRFRGTGLPVMVQSIKGKALSRVTLTGESADDNPILLPYACRKLSEHEYLLILQPSEKYELSEYYLAMLTVN